MRSKSLPIFLICIAFGAVSAAFAEPAKLVSPLDQAQVLRGWVDVQTTGDVVTVQVGRPDGTIGHLFKVEVKGQSESPVSFQSDYAQAFYWRGHLVVLAVREAKALHFSIPGFDAPPAPGTGSFLPGIDLDHLGARYELAEIATATAILSGQGPQATLNPEWGEPRRLFKSGEFTPPPGGGGGVSGCGSSCSISCRDGSTCSITCGDRRCASCTCPLLCQCS